MLVSSGSFGLHAGGLDDRAPFLVVGANLFIELPRRAADRGSTEFYQTLLDGIGVQGCDEIMREFVDEVGRHAGRSEQSPPYLGVVARDGLGHAWDIRQ